MTRTEAFAEAKRRAFEPPFEAQLVTCVDGEYDVSPSNGTLDCVIAMGAYVAEISSDYRNAAVEDEQTEETGVGV
jgi:hypothetical protein